MFFRFFGIYMFILAGVASIALPTNILGMIGSSEYLIKQRELAIVVDILRITIYAGAGAAFLFFSRPLAKLIAKGLDNIEQGE